VRSSAEAADYAVGDVLDGALRKINHPNVVKVLRAGKINSRS
jgi:hypothetical protein